MALAALESPADTDRLNSCGAIFVAWCGNGSDDDLHRSAC